MAIEDFLDARQDGPDGQYVVLLTRLPYDRARMIERATITAGNLSDFADACLTALAWEGKVTDYLTGEDAEMEFGRGDPAVVMPWRDRAVELYVEWKKVALPGPKGSPRKARRTRPT